MSLETHTLLFDAATAVSAILLAAVFTGSAVERIRRWRHERRCRLFAVRRYSEFREP